MYLHNGSRIKKIFVLLIPGAGSRLQENGQTVDTKSCGTTSAFAPAVTDSRILLREGMFNNLPSGRRILYCNVNCLRWNPYAKATHLSGPMPVIAGFRGAGMAPAAEKLAGLTT